MTQAKRGKKTKKPEPSPRRGQKPAPATRRDAILDAAAAVFLEEGYERACIDHVIARIGGSKRTIYNEFGSKEGLFAEVIRVHTARAVATLPDTEAEGRTVREALVDFGLSLMRVLMSPGSQALYRVVMAECRKFPELGRVYYDGGPGEARSRLMRLLAEYERRGEVALKDHGLAAEALLSMLRGNQHMQAVLGLRAPLTAAEIRRIVESKVDIFLDGVRAKR